MTLEEKKIEESARKIAEYFVGTDYDYIDINNTSNHLKSDEAIKEYHTKDMYTIDDISKIFVGEDKNGGLFDDFLDYRISLDMQGIKTKPTFKEWFNQNKKK